MKPFEPQVSDDTPNLLDAMLGADAEGIDELIDELARRIGALPHKIEIVISSRKHGSKGKRKPLIGILRHDGRASYHCSDMPEVLKRNGYRAERPLTEELWGEMQQARDEHGNGSSEHVLAEQAWREAVEQ